MLKNIKFHNIKITKYNTIFFNEEYRFKNQYPHSTHLATYSFSAVSLSIPFKAFQASHFALPVKSNIPGLAVLQSPTFAYLNLA